MAMPTTGSQRSTAPVVRTTPGFVTQSQQSGSGSIQTNLFGGTKDDPVAGLCQWMREQWVRREEHVEEILSSSESGEDPVPSDNSSSEGEDEGTTTSSQADDSDSLPASTHRPVTRSTPKRPISRPKRKAYKSKGSGPGSSSQKRSKGQN